MNKQASTSKYDYSQLISRESKHYMDFCTFINDKIKDYRIKYCDGETRDFTRETLAEIIGINVSTLTKIINGSQRTRKRDIVIAICFALKLNVDDTNKALDLYQMASLSSNNMRDLVIKQARCDDFSISDLDNALEYNNFPKLNLLREKREKTSSFFYYPPDDSEFEELSVMIQPYDVAGSDTSLSLHERYRVDKYDYHSEMNICKKGENNQKFKIVLDNGTCEINQLQGNDWICVYSNDPFWNIDEQHQKIQICSNLQNKITKLKEYQEQKARYVYNVSKDTRNYVSRFDAVNNNGQIMIYGETFGYDKPELCEYYQIEITSDKCTFSISDTSKFMERYLGEEKWEKTYGDPLPPAIHRFNSPQEIPNDRWKLQYKKLLDMALDLLTKIQKRQLFLFNARAWLDIDDIMHLYNVEEAFECIRPDNMPYESIPQKDYIIGTDGEKITINDLYRAAELDIYTIDELCSIRQHYGSLEKFLYIDMLTEQKGTKNE